LRWLRSCLLQEPQVEGGKYQDDSDVYYQPRPEVVPEEEDVRADHDGDHREHVQHDGCLSSHCFVLLCSPEWSKIGDRRNAAVFWRISGKRLVRGSAKRFRRHV
jgi:hypothetical protein